MIRFASGQTRLVLRLENYLLDSWHASTRPAALDLDETASLQWLGLEQSSEMPA